MQCTVVFVMAGQICDISYEDNNLFSLLLIVFLSLGLSTSVGFILYYVFISSPQIVPIILLSGESIILNWSELYYDDVMLL